jgi:hypothetical protein
MATYRRRLIANCPIPYQDGREEKTQWLRCGSAFENQDGSVTVLLDVLPLNGKLVLFEPKDDDRNRDANPRRR